MFHDGEMGTCPECGRRIMLPCLACEIETNGLIETGEGEIIEEESDPGDPLAIMLWDSEERKRYWAVRRFRDEHRTSMFENTEVEVSCEKGE